MKNINFKQWLWAICLPATFAASTALAQPRLEEEIKKTSTLRTQAEQLHDINALMKCYDEQIIFMPEYQLTLQGKKELEAYYENIFRQQKTTSFSTHPVEYIYLGKTTIETGIFDKKYIYTGTDTSQKLKGKYFRIWHTSVDGNIKLAGESFGYFYSLPHPEHFVMAGAQRQPDEMQLTNTDKVPFELKAYNALMEKGVRTRNGLMRSQFFTPDAIIMPYADTIIAGIERIRPYLLAYSSRGTVTINEVTCYTLHFENIGDYIIEYAMFKVKWTNTNGPGRTEGKGIRLWKKQKDGSLRLHREIATHNHIPAEFEFLK